MLKIRHATPDDHMALSVLIVHTFEQNNEYKLTEGLRKSGEVALELVAELDGQIVAYICFSRLSHPDGWWALAPICVANAYQGKGIGSELVRYGLDQARQARAKAVVVVGSPAYYRRFGFVYGGAADLRTPYPTQYTGLYPIQPDTASAATTLVYADAFEDV